MNTQQTDRSLEHIEGTPNEIALALHNDAVTHGGKTAQPKGDSLKDIIRKFDESLVSITATPSQASRTSHSPLPWNVAKSITGAKPFVHEKCTSEGTYSYDCIVENDEMHIALIGGRTRREAIANAQLIVRPRLQQRPATSGCAGRSPNIHCTRRQWSRPETRSRRSLRSPRTMGERQAMMRVLVVLAKIEKSWDDLTWNLSCKLVDAWNKARKEAKEEL